MLCFNSETGQIDAALLAQEITFAEQFRRKHTAKNAEVARRFMGNWHRDDYEDVPVPENLIFAYVVWMLPELAFANPTCHVTPRRVISDKQIAEYMDMALKAWASETEYVEELQDVCRDALLGYGVIKVGLEPRDEPGSQGGQGENTPLTPFAVRIPPESLIMDPRCEKPKDARFMGHSYWKDLADLQGAGGRWDPAAVEKLSTMSTDSQPGNPVEQPVRYGATAERRQVNLVDVWIRELGLIVTMARSGQQTEPVILRQEKYWGPPEGPYEVFGFYSVGGDPYPLSPVAAVMEQFEELQAHAAQASDEATNYKRFGLVEATASDTANAVMNARSGDIWPVKSIGNTFREIELGGSPPGRLAHMLQLRERFDRTIGIGDAQRGLLQGKTATETQLVQSNVDNRTEYMRGRFAHSTARVNRRVGWYMFYDPSVVMDVSTHDQQTGTPVQAQFLGGPQPGQEDVHWFNFHLTTDATSMQRSDDQVLVNRALQTLQLAEQVSGLMMQDPMTNWRYIVDNFGEATNQRQLSTILFNRLMLAQSGQMPQAFGMGMPQPLPAGADPKFAAMGLGFPPGQDPATAPGIGGPRPGFAVSPGQSQPPFGGAPSGGGAGGPRPPMMFGGARPRPGGAPQPPRAGGGGFAPGPRARMKGGGAPTARPPLPRGGFNAGPRAKAQAPAAGRAAGPFPAGPRARKKAAAAAGPKP